MDLIPERSTFNQGWIEGRLAGGEIILSMVEGYFENHTDKPNSLLHILRERIEAWEKP